MNVVKTREILVVEVLHKPPDVTNVLIHFQSMINANGLRVKA
jgi:hypothetical protein